MTRTACPWIAYAWATLIVASASADPVRDVTMTIPTAGGSVVTTGGDWTGEFAGRVFEGIATSISGTLTYTDNPGFYAADFTFPLTTTGSQARLRLDFTKELLYWSGTALEAPAAGLRVSYGGRSAWITGADAAGAPGILLSTAVDGGFHEHARFSIPTSAPSGLYGFTSVLGPDGTSVGTFQQSLPLLITIQKGSLSGEQYAAGMNAMVNVALVPEPSTLGMAAALGGCCVAGLRAMVRNRRRRRGLRPAGRPANMQINCT